MIVDCIADLHGHYPKLEGGDLLIVAGDLTAKHTLREFNKFSDWIVDQPYDYMVVIAGNHDTWLEGAEYFQIEEWKNRGMFQYLCDCSTSINGYKIWGTPWTLSFCGINPLCRAFTCRSEEEIAKKWELIPEDVDILVTHGPMYGILDWTVNFDRAGSRELRNTLGRIKPKLVCHGHIHECYGEAVAETFTGDGGYHIVNCSHVNERYEPVNAPIRVILDD